MKTICQHKLTASAAKKKATGSGKRRQHTTRQTSRVQPVQGGGPPSGGTGGGAGGQPPMIPLSPVGGGGTPAHDRARDVVSQALAQHANLRPAQAQEYRDAAFAIISFFTVSAANRFNAHVRGYRFFSSLDELSAHCVPGFSQVPQTLRQYVLAVGAYNVQTEEIEVDGGGRFAGFVFTTQDRFAHEFGHALDGPQRDISSTSEWRGAWQAEIVPHPPNLNAQTALHEGFAAFAAMVFGTQADRTALEQTHPACVQVWRSWGLW